MTEQNEINPLEYKKLQLKVQALLQTNISLTDNNADLRADITMLSDYTNELQTTINVLNQDIAEVRNGLVEDTQPDATDPTS